MRWLLFFGLLCGVPHIYSFPQEGEIPIEGEIPLEPEFPEEEFPVTDLDSEVDPIFQGTSCPNVKPMDNLSIDKIIGTWFVTYQLQPSSPCAFWNISRNPNDTNQLILQEKQIVLLTDSVGIQLKQFVESDPIYINIPDPSMPSKMIIERPVSSPAKVDHFVIFDTDYEKYIGVYECDEGEGFLHRRDVTILSKLPTHDSEIRKRIERLLFNVGIDNAFVKISENVGDQCEFYSPYQFGPGVERSLNIKNGDMTDTMLIKAVSTARVAFDLFKKNAEIARFIKIAFDNEYNTTWNCLVGLDFDGTVSYKRGNFMLFSLGKRNILLFKSPIGLPDN